MSREVVADLGVGSFHCRQARHVSMMLGIILRVEFGTPAACRRSCMRFSGACHHLKCNSLSSRRTTPGRTERRSCNDLPRSHRDQSVASSACVPASRLVVRCRVALVPSPSSSEAAEASSGGMCPAAGAVEASREEEEADVFAPSAGGPGASVVSGSRRS